MTLLIGSRRMYPKEQAYGFLCTDILVEIIAHEPLLFSASHSSDCQRKYSCWFREDSSVRPLRQTASLISLSFSSISLRMARPQWRWHGIHADDSSNTRSCLVQAAHRLRSGLLFCEKCGFANTIPSMAPKMKRKKPTGWLINSQFVDNYFGFYCYEADDVSDSAQHLSREHRVWHRPARPRVRVDDHLP